MDTLLLLLQMISKYSSLKWAKFVIQFNIKSIKLNLFIL